MPIEVIYDEQFESPKTVVELLQRARKVIEDEARWIQAELFKPVYNYKGERIPLTCGNVRVCALGALGVACWDGAAIDFAVNGKRPALLEPLIDGDAEDGIYDVYNWIDKDPIANKASQFLNSAAGTIMGTVSVSIMGLNDSSHTTHERLLKAFDLAIEYAKDAE